MASNITKLQEKINSELDLILDDFEGQYDLIGFDKEKFIQIDYDLIESFDFENLKNNSEDNLSILFENDNDSIGSNTNISKNDFDLKYAELSNSCQCYLEKYGISNLYISLGLVEFTDFLAPCILIPIFIEKNKDGFRIIRNFNQKIQFNGVLKFILDEENVDFPEFDGNITNFIKQFLKLNEIKYSPEAYIGNFDLRFQHILYDLNVYQWESIEEKFNLFKKNQDSFIKLERENFKKKLEQNAYKLGIKDDVFHLKSLLSMNNNILVVSNNDLIRKKIISSFKNQGLESMILDLSENLSNKKFYEDVNKELIIDDEIIMLDDLVKNHEKYSKIIDLINNTNYSNFEISPKEIKARKDNFTNIIQDLNLDNINFEIENVKNFNEDLCLEMLEQIKEITSIDEHIFNLQNHFSLDYLESDEFNNLVEISKFIKRHLTYFSRFNTELHEKYQIKIFEDIFSVNQLRNIFICNKNMQFIENNDFNLINDYLENIDDVKYNGDNNLQKYFQADDDIIKSIYINFKYTELINNGVIPIDFEFILDDFDNFKILCNHFIRVSNYILKELYYIINFYKKFDLFEIDLNLLKININLDNIEKLVHSFKKDMETLVNFKKNFISFKIINGTVKKFINIVYKNKFKDYEIQAIFWYNIYNSLLNNFLNDYEYIDENKISDIYESEFNEIDSKISYDNELLLIQHIYSKSLELNNSENAINQKENLIKNYEQREIEIMRTVLSKYKEFITANKRIFLIDMSLISQCLDESYENHFDYVITTQELNFNLDKLSLLLRSKNKIIEV